MVEGIEEKEALAVLKFISWVDKFSPKMFSLLIEAVLCPRSKDYLGGILGSLLNTSSTNPSLYSAT